MLFCLEHFLGIFWANFPACSEESKTAQSLEECKLYSAQQTVNEVDLQNK